MKKLVLLLTLVLLLVSCNKDSIHGEPVDKAAEIITLKELLANPAKYHEKTVTMRGTVDGQCGNKCEFTYAENKDAHTIYVGDIEAPNITKGTPILVSAFVFNGDEKLVLTARGFELKAKGGK